MKSLTFRTKILLLVIVPLILISTMLTALAIYQATELGKKNVASFESKIYDLRRNELKSYTELAASTVEHIYEQEYTSFDDQQEAQEQVKDILRDLAYGENGYFFAYDYNAVNLVNPKQPALEGRNLRGLKDDNGVLLIQGLIARAQEGGGYTRYIWDKPSLGRKVDKISYTMDFGHWKWILGTGLYVDDLDDSIKVVSDQVDDNIGDTLKLIGLVALGGTLLVGIIGTRLTLSEGKLADDKLQQLSRKNVEVQEAERSRVSRQLQSGINQALVASRAKFLKAAKARSLTEPAARKEFINAVSILNKTIKEVYRISGELRPSVLDQMGLYPALETLASEVSDRVGIAVGFKKMDMDERLRPEMEIAVYRIVQEALKNIELHSKAKEVSVHIHHTSTLLTLSIQDNGIGFPVKSVLRDGNKAGIGLIDMRVRAESLGGTLAVSSPKGAGTMIEVEMPI